MNNVFFVAVTHSSKDLTEFDTSVFLLHTTMNHQIIIQFTTIGVFHDEKNSVFGLNDFVQTYNVGMVKELHDANFSVQFAQLLFIQLRLINDFDGYLTSVFVKKPTS